MHDSRRGGRNHEARGNSLRLERQLQDDLNARGKEIPAPSADKNAIDKVYGSGWEPNHSGGC
jgi:hypothetical protein